MKVIKTKSPDQIKVSKENQKAFVEVSMASQKRFLDSLPTARVQRLGVDEPWPVLTA